ncbi:MAG: OadG family protein [Verrucomicrobiota bacterium]|jgi:oxaloacetate decarboxylase gamma subunit|nr:OadG family protein [Verrucomicrobiota bacterium]
MEKLLQGLVLLVAGMGIVYLFLSLLVWVMDRSSKVISRFSYILPDEEPKKKPRAAVKPAGDATEVIAVAIAAAKARAA